MAELIIVTSNDALYLLYDWWFERGIANNWETIQNHSVNAFSIIILIEWQFSIVFEVSGDWDLRFPFYHKMESKIFCFFAIDFDEFAEKLKNKIFVSKRYIFNWLIVRFTCGR